MVWATDYRVKRNRGDGRLYVGVCQIEMSTSDTPKWLHSWIKVVHLSVSVRGVGKARHLEACRMHDKTREIWDERQFAA